MQIRTCHCGKQFENARYPGGPNKYGRSQKHCSPRCVAISTKCRYYGLSTEDFWKWHKLGCLLCGRHPSGKERQLSIDHEHTKDEVFGVPNASRRQYVRGLLCTSCNRFRVGPHDLESAKKLVLYLERRLLPI